MIPEAPLGTRFDSNKTMVEDGRTFFCSELIAKAYKVFGIYRSSKSCTQIYPKHFQSKDRTIKLINARLGEEMAIVDDY